MIATSPPRSLCQVFFKTVMLAGSAAAVMQGCDLAPKAERGTGEPVGAFVAGRPVSAAAAGGSSAAASSSTPAAAPTAPAAATATTPPAPDLSPFPFVTVNLKQRTVAVEGTIAVDVHDPETPRVWLEVLACSPDSKEHEALLVTKARPSHIHAALLLMGAQPGEPGRVEWDGAKVKPIAPRGPEVGVAFVVGAGIEPQQIAPEQWITLSTTGKPPEKLRFVFSGSGFTTTKAQGTTYAADNAGTIVGLTTFGTETIALVDVFSPDSGLQAPEFLASASLPKRGTPVTMILTVR